MTESRFKVHVNQEVKLIPGMIAGTFIPDRGETCEVCGREDLRDYVKGPPPLYTVICDACCQALGQVAFPMPIFPLPDS
jgi:hypothetical protein